MVKFRKWLAGICWDIADTAWGWEMKLYPIEWRDIVTSEAPDIHANCIPKPTVRTVNVTYVPGKGLVPVPATAANTSTAVVDWDTTDHLHDVEDD